MSACHAVRRCKPEHPSKSISKQAAAAPALRQIRSAVVISQLRLTCTRAQSRPIQSLPEACTPCTATGVAARSHWLLLSCWGPSWTHRCRWLWATASCCATNLRLMRCARHSQILLSLPDQLGAASLRVFGCTWTPCCQEVPQRLMQESGWQARFNERAWQLVVSIIVMRPAAGQCAFAQSRY